MLEEEQKLDISESAQSLINFANKSDNDYYQDKESVDDNSHDDNEERRGFNLLQDIRESLDMGSIKKNIKPVLIGGFYLLFLSYIIWQCIGIGKAIYYIDNSYVKLSLFNVIMVFLSITIFVISTFYKFWNFHKQKISFFILCIFNFSLLLTTIIFQLVYFLLVRILLLVSIGTVTAEMVLFLGRFLLGVLTFVIIFFITKNLLKLTLESTNKQNILTFKISEYVDTRKNKKYIYDVNIIQYMKDGTKHIIFEVDRFLHMVIDGTTGTGKTSSTMSVKIVNDLDKKVLNEDKQKRMLKQLLTSGKVYMDAPFDDSSFNIKYFHATKGNEKLLEEIKKNYKSAGMTVVAPNSSLTDEIYNLAIARGFKCNRVDPILVPGKNERKPGSIGINPLFISPTIPEWDRNREIIKKATLFADVLQSLNEMKGKGDPYFIGINRSVTTAVTILLEKTYPILNKGKQPNPGHVQSLINDFTRIRRYYDEFIKLPDIDEFEFVKDFIKYDLLGKGAEKMIEQARGLRIILNEFLTNPLVKAVLCAEETIDMDKMLAEGEITVVNYALELGTTDSVGLGLFFVLSFNDAVLRRPGTESTRLPHFYDIDELPVLINPQMEKCFSLFRQYRVAMTVAIQSLDQMEKTDLTKYLKGILMGCGHHIVFGRSSTTDMKMYSELAGKKVEMVSHESVSQTALSTDNPSYTYSERYTPTETDVVPTSEVRNRGFQEVTVFTVSNGNIVPPFYGRVSFMSQRKRKKVRRYYVDWKAYYTKDYENNLPAAGASILDKEIFITSQGKIESVPMVPSGSIVLTEKNKIEKECSITTDNQEQKVNIKINDVDTIDNMNQIYIDENGEEEVKDEGISIYDL